MRTKFKETRMAKFRKKPMEEKWLIYVCGDDGNPLFGIMEHQATEEEELALEFIKGDLTDEQISERSHEAFKKGPIEIDVVYSCPR